MLCENCGRNIDASISVDLNTNTLRIKEGETAHELKLMPQEAELAFVLASRRPKVVPHAELLKNLWPSDADKPVNPKFILRSYVSRLRQYLKPYGWAVVSVFEQGYRLERESA